MAEETTTKVIVVEDTSESTLYALIIGVNSYPHITPLKGAVADADEISNFLISDLKVPLDHITNLRDKEASRANIIKGFRDLRDDPRIKKGDPILIYYAGHGGSQVPSQKQQQAFGSSNIQVIFPHDYQVQHAGDAAPTNCIPDKTIAALLSDISRVKGDNVTVIFDCCHSASATRLDYTTRQPRHVEVKMEIPDNIDSDILSSKSTAGPAKTRHIGLSFHANQSSHIHFAACGDEEKAWEENGHGVFTTTLLKAIRTHGVDKITYHNLMISLPNLPRQSPHCYGIHTSRVLFNARVPSRQLVFVPVKFEDDKPILQAGAATGVAYESAWELREFPTDDSPILGRFIAQPPNVSTTELKPEADDQTLPQLPTQLYARQVGPGSGNELKVWFSPEAKFKLFESADANNGTATPGSSEHEVGYVTQEERDSADLMVELSDSGTEVIFHLNDPQAEECGVATLKYRKPARRDEVEEVLFAAAKWHWHLNRTPESASQRVTMELVKLPPKTDDEYNLDDDDDAPVSLTAKPELIDSATGVANVVVRPDKLDYYGLKIDNCLNLQLHIAAFYFSTADFAIYTLTGASISNDSTDAELPQKGSRIIGRDLGSPMAFELDPDSEAELGYFKLFWSTDPLQLNITQGSVFEKPEGSGKEPRRKMVTAKHLFRRDWGVTLLALVQRPPQSEAS